MKKKYSLPAGISSEISTTVDLVKNNIGSLNYKIIPINAIEFDPNNPRELALTREDLPLGPLVEDPLYERKLLEFESLKQTAETIKKYGVRNAVEIYKYGNSYRLIHGERRCLSSIIAGKKEIPAKILDEKPSNLDIRLLQLIENVQREDLTLYETLNNIRQVIHEYKSHIKAHVTLDVPLLESLINRSKTHCLNFIAVLNAPPDMQALIKSGQIRSLEKAALIAKVKLDEDRNALLRYCLDGASLKQLKYAATQQKKTHHLSLVSTAQKKRPGKPSTKISLGSTLNKKTVSKLIALVLAEPAYKKYKEKLTSTPLISFADYAHTFSQLIKLMDKIEI